MAWAYRCLVLYCTLLGQAGSTTTPSSVTCEVAETNIICEGLGGSIDCGANLIRICAAVYGRTDELNCRHQSISDTSCGMDVVAILGEECDGMTRCGIRSSNRLAGDPCPGTYKYLNISYSCEDVDECALNTDNCHHNSTCTNTPGSFICTCDVGFTGNGTNCIDIDECSLTRLPCGPNAVCTNNPGSFQCTCNTGFTRVGSICRPPDVDECALNTDNCHPNSTCTNTPRSFTCTCNDGLTGNGTSCIDIDECSTGIPCGTNAVCTNNQGSFQCTCNSGFTRDGSVCSPTGDSLASVLPIVVVILLVLLITVLIIAVICHRRRKHLASSKDKKLSLKASATAVQNPSYETENFNDQNEYTECADLPQRSSNAINASLTQGTEQHEYTELPSASEARTPTGNVAIYNEVGEEDYNVLFGGKEVGEYHEYNLPDSRLEAPSAQNPYQDLIRENSYLEITPGDRAKGAGEDASKPDLANGRTVHDKQKNPTSPTAREDEHGYQDLRRDDDNYTSLDLDGQVATTSSSQDQERVSSVENGYQALQLNEAEYLELQ